MDLLGAGHNSGPSSPRDSVVIGLAHAAEGGDAGLEEVVLGEVREALLGDDDVGLGSDDL